MRPNRLFPSLLLAVALILGGCEKAPTPEPTPAPAATPTAQAAPVDAALPGPAPVAGTDYVEIRGGAPFAPAVGKVEVVEVFGYSCPHCAQFEPMLEAWAKRQPAHVNLVRVPAPFGGFWVPYAKAYYVAQELGLEDATHRAMFDAIHVGGTLPAPPAVPTDAQIAAFYAGHGADPKDVTERMGSYAMQAKLKRAMAFIMRSGVDGTPTLVVNGKYRVLGRSAEDALRITEHLVAREHAAAR
ncbi:thiol:disulfide interchange protein DsbA/DsbL [Lysobacter humi (ex Lee et al. 2017)]